jgi:hypothetical protein
MAESFSESIVTRSLRGLALASIVAALAAGSPAMIAGAHSDDVDAPPIGVQLAEESEVIADSGSELEGTEVEAAVADEIAEVDMDLNEIATAEETTELLSEASADEPETVTDESDGYELEEAGEPDVLLEDDAAFEA